MSEKAGALDGAFGMKKNRIQGMVRLIDQWRNMVPHAVADGSKAQVEYALKDAKHDIDVLWHKVTSQAAEIERPREPVAWQRRCLFPDKHTREKPQWQDCHAMEVKSWPQHDYQYRPLYAAPLPLTDLEAENARLKAELAAVKEMYAREGAKALYELERAERAEARLAEALKALDAIVERSNNDPLGTSKVIDMRRIAQDALAKAEGRA